jgi:two-component system LytT family response regulator
MKLLIVDNEAPLRNSTKSILQAFCADITDIEEAGSVSQGIEMINSFKPDIILLDVELGDGTGFDILKQIHNLSFQLIFITAHNEYAIQAFRFSAIDYLLKPLDPIALQESMAKATHQIKNNYLHKQIEVLMQQLHIKPDTDRKIVLKDAEHIYFTQVSSIVYCLADGPYTKFYLENGEVIMVSKNLKEYEAMLEQFGFIRTHHSYLVNSHKITRFDKINGGCLILNNNIEVPLSQRKKEYILNLLENKVV